MIQWVKMVQQRNIAGCFGKFNLQSHMGPISVNKSIRIAIVVPHCKRRCEVIVKMLQCLDVIVLLCTTE